MPNRRSGDTRPKQGRSPRPRPQASSAGGNGVVLGRMLSVLRLLYAPVMLWAVVIAEDETIALSAFGLAILTDLLDSWLNRNQLGRRRAGELLDAAANTVFVLAGVFALWRVDVVPWPIALLVLLRVLAMLALTPALRSRGVRTLPVHVLGKAAAFCLLVSFPMLYLSRDIPETLDLGLEPGLPTQLAQAFGWAFALWGILLLWWSLVLYVQEVRRLMATTAPIAKGGAASA